MARLARRIETPEMTLFKERISAGQGKFAMLQSWFARNYVCFPWENHSLLCKSSNATVEPFMVFPTAHLGDAKISRQSRHGRRAGQVAASAWRHGVQLGLELDIARISSP